MTGGRALCRRGQLTSATHALLSERPETKQPLFTQDASRPPCWCPGEAECIYEGHFSHQEKPAELTLPDYEHELRQGTKSACCFTALGWTSWRYGINSHQVTHN